MKNESASSLSFLDLLTCCLGAMLLLFFVIILIKKQSDSEGNTQGSAPGEAEEAFIVIVAEANQSLFKSATGDGWRLEKEGKRKELPENVYQSSANKYAIFYVRGDIDSGTELWLNNISSEAEIQVTVYGGQETAESYRLSTAENGPIYVW